MQFKSYLNPAGKDMIMTFKIEEQTTPYILTFLPLLVAKWVNQGQGRK